MQLALGPVLYARGATPQHVDFAIAVLVDADADACPIRIEIEGSGGAIELGQPEIAEDFRDVGCGVLWSWPVRVARAPSERRLRYRLRSRRAAVAGLPEGWIGPVLVPAEGALPRIAFFSCNGFSDPAHLRNEKQPYALWEDVDRAHRAEAPTSPQDPPPGFHLLVGGGDQVYADELWQADPLLAQYGELDHDRMIDVRLPATAARDLARSYVALYVDRYGKKPFADVIARVPVAFTWDDHDIFDGWGSYPDELQASRLFQAVYAAARRAFVAFQLGGRSMPTRVGSARRKHLLQALTFDAGDEALELVLLDLRSERSLAQVLSQEQHADLRAWLADHAKRVASPGSALRRFVLVVSSVPLAYMRFGSLAERPTSVLRPFHPFRIDDDMRDQWESHLHRGEKAQVVVTLLDHAAQSRSRVAVLSGDVHVGSRARFVSRDPAHRIGDEPDAVIEQLTSSSIVHPPPSEWQFRGMRVVAHESNLQVARYVESELLGIGEDRYLRERNWMTLAFDEGGEPPRTRLWAQWRIQGARMPEQVVIESPLPRTSTPL